jgi:hypothetical protein
MSIQLLITSRVQRGITSYMLKIDLTDEFAPLTPVPSPGDHPLPCLINSSSLPEFNKVSHAIYEKLTSLTNNPSDVQTPVTSPMNHHDSCDHVRSIPHHFPSSTRYHMLYKVKFVWKNALWPPYRPPGGAVRETLTSSTSWAQTRPISENPTQIHPFVLELCARINSRMTRWQDDKITRLQDYKMLTPHF